MAHPRRLPSYDDETAWRRIYAALPARLRPPEPLAVQEEWRPLAGFDVHVDRWIAPQPRARMIVLHGGGGHGRLLGPYGWRLALHGIEAVIPDLPGYGLTQTRRKSTLVYQDWRDVAAALIEEERAKGGALFVFGLSMGGMLAFDAAALTGAADGLIATCLLDPTRSEVRRGVVRFAWMAGLIDPMFALTPRFLDGAPVPMALAGNMADIANDPDLVRAIIEDRRAGGNAMPVGFLRTWLQGPPACAPDDFDVCPVLMVHPADDRWTSLSISQPFFDALSVTKRLVMLENAGHFPIETPGADQMDTAITGFVDALVDHRPIPDDLLG